MSLNYHITQNLYYSGKIPMFYQKTDVCTTKTEPYNL